MRAHHVAAVLVGASLAACGIDLFHSTDFDTLCASDPTADACASSPDATADGPGTKPDGNTGDGSDTGNGDGGDAEGGTPGEGGGRDSAPTDFCTWTLTDAHTAARRACAWLGACVGALGPNDLGQCFEDALRAYDCPLFPNRQVTGKLHKYWDCLQQVTSCADVLSCVTAGAGAGCSTGAGPGDFAECAAAGDVGYDCAPDGGAPLAIVGCPGQGRACQTVGSSPLCVGTAGVCVGSPPPSCNAAKVQYCGGGTDQGVDCALFGAGSCVTNAGVGPSCLPTAGATACTPDASVLCYGAVALGCPSGRIESLDCHDLLENAGTCTGTSTGPAWDVARACTASGSACTAGCTSDGGVVGCHRGPHRLEVNCADYGLKPCKAVTHLSVSTYQCAPP